MANILNVFACFLQSLTNKIVQSAQVVDCTSSAVGVLGKDQILS